jgi:hypothetical protein
VLRASDWADYLRYFTTFAEASETLDVLLAAEALAR